MTLQNNSIKKKCQGIRLVLTDVDGVLTDGGMYYSNKGEVFKKFNTRDGMAVELLQKNKIPVIFITKEKSQIVFSRAKKLKISDIFVDVTQKELLLPKICKKYKIKKNNVAYIGDDINDLAIIKKVGFSACPKDSVLIIQKNSDYICKLDGGKGVLREIADLILKFHVQN